MNPEAGESAAELLDRLEVGIPEKVRSTAVQLVSVIESR
jgi:hypothetical protein